MQVANWIAVTMAVGGYVLGSIPFGVVASRCLGTVDPRTAGSRNIGFTNVLRVAGTKTGLLTLAGDLGKGWIIAWMGVQTIQSEGWILMVAASPVVGHLYPLFLKFRGGKGVATAFGAIIGVVPWMGSTMVGIWIITAVITRYSSGAALAAFVAFPVLAAAARMGWEFQVFSLCVSGLILIKHKDNAVRLWNGTEPKIGQRPIVT